ncbi:MAG TPA: pyridoxal-phosphate dependent enzyme, partial [Acidimicrobiales bacterium]|nr:pyridoxal-phosphate dependent enzyme [Acidimicrobiales bacterium]
MGEAPPLDRRLALVHLPTPMEPLDRLGAHLGMAPGRLWVKRDDVTGLAGGGNKARKLEYLCADALAQGCDTLVTGGGRQSNHVRMTAAAANRLGLGCTIVLNAERPEVPMGNLLLDELLGPDIVWAGDGTTQLDYYGVEAAIADTARRLAGEGRRPYAIPIGGASAVGALGYVRAGVELRR